MKKTVFSGIMAMVFTASVYGADAQQGNGHIAADAGGIAQDFFRPGHIREVEHPGGFTPGHVADDFQARIIAALDEGDRHTALIYQPHEHLFQGWPVECPELLVGHE